MATYNLIKETDASTGQRSTPLGTNEGIRIKNLEIKIEKQSDKLDQITSILNAISEKTSAS